jgi:alkaline phosphatase D
MGGLAEFQVLDTRQYRTDQPCGDGMQPVCAEADDPAATMLGDAQRAWLFDGLNASKARWNVLAHQVPIAPVGRMGENGMVQSMDKWAGYSAERDRVMSFLQERSVRNPISIVGDVHVNWLADLRTRYYADAPTIGTEFVGTSISSGGDGGDTNAGTAAMLSANPHVRFFNGQRGYGRCEVTADRWRTDYRVVEYVTRPGAPIATRASFVVEDGKAGASPA